MKKTLFIFIMSISCYACNNETTPGISEPAKNDTTPKPITIDDVRKQKPTIAGYHELSLNIADSSRNLRVILNNDELVKCWMVYYDRIERHWNTLSWTGKGKDNKILVDTVFNQLTGINDSFTDPPTFYMATSRDDGETWESLDMSPVSLTCPGDLPKRRAQFAQLIISNDFTRSSHLPSLTMAWQWNHLVNRIGRGPAANMDFSSLCSGLKEMKLER